MLKAPLWDTEEYNFLTPDLAGPRAWLERKQILAEIETCQTRLRNIASGPPRGLTLRKIIEDRIFKRIKELGNEKQRKMLLKQWAERVREESMKLRRYGAAVGDAALEANARQIADLYFQFDIQKFQQDFEDVFLEEVTEPAAEELVAKLTEAEASQATLLKNRWTAKACAKFFTSGRIPRTFRTFRAANYGGDDGPARADLEMVDRILSAFFEDWRGRVVHFDVPVTVGGYGIHTLGGDLRESWQSLYEQLGYDKLPHAQRFQWLDAGGAGASKVESGEGLPGKFAKK